MKTLALTEGRKHLFALCDEVENGEDVTLTRRGGKDMALVTREELDALRRARDQVKIDSLLDRYADRLTELSDR
ncbi:TPA: type II toxin-antitoxin system Phd/YefM family antitoxin [Enterobacter hormaechei subsp. xiangfangensis]|nr:type II toxin-antitoxin system Phd/YefM family antitoxin [Enterobacter hormaechei subsp. xiangfangensis]HAV1890655.1 type II toxin-antitoxin system Phd/YefM family antitoxin [Enterobacter hormaechei subsp. xiangfangensis]